MATHLDHTHTHGDHRLCYGHPLPFGASHVPAGINFSISSTHATACTLVLFLKGAALPFAEIPFPPEFRLGNVWAMTVFGLDYEEIEYGYRFDGTHDPREGQHFDPKNILLDPYAREIGGRDAWKQAAQAKSIPPGGGCRSRTSTGRIRVRWSGRKANW